MSTTDFSMMSYIGKVITYISQENIFVHDKTKQKNLDFLLVIYHLMNIYGTLMIYLTKTDRIPLVKPGMKQILLKSGRTFADSSSRRIFWLQWVGLQQWMFKEELIWIILINWWSPGPSNCVSEKIYRWNREMVRRKNEWDFSVAWLWDEGEIRVQDGTQCSLWVQEDGMVFSKGIIGTAMRRTAGAQF